MPAARTRGRPPGPLRVLHVTGCYPPAGEWGGAPAAAHGLARAARARGLAVEVFTTTQRSCRDLPPIAPGPGELDGVPVTWFRSLHGLGRAFLAPALARALRRRARAFDLLHLHMLWTFPGLAAARLARAAGVPYVISPHGALDPWALGQRALEKRAFLALAERRNLRAAALLHFTTEAERAAAPAWARALPARVVPLPVDGAPFRGLGEPAVRAASRELLLLGRVHPMKGFDVLVPALRAVVAREPRARLTVAGPDEGGHLAVVRRAVAAAGLEGHVTFTGLLDAAGRAGALARAALLVLPSHRENFGLAVAEGMAAGLPVVISPQVNIADEVEAAGAGAVVARDPAALAAALLDLLADPARRARMGEAGRRLVAERWGEGAVGAALEAAYAEAVERYRSAST